MSHLVADFATPQGVTVPAFMYVHALPGSYEGDDGDGILVWVEFDGQRVQVPAGLLSIPSPHDEGDR